MSAAITTIRRTLLTWLFASVFFPISNADELALTLNSGQLVARGESGRSHQLQASRDLANWGLVYAIRDQATWSWLDPDERLFGRRYYRLVESQPAEITPHSSWRTSITLPGDAFLSAPLGGAEEVRYVKFALLMDGLPTVYFQDSAAYPFHFQFATERLDPLAGLTLPEFNEQSLHLAGQTVVLGAVLWAPDKNEYGIQFVGQDAYPRELVRLLFDSVEAAIVNAPEVGGFYFPTFEQSQSAQQEKDYFATNGIGISSAARWSSEDASYSDGWAVGRLVFVTAAEIDAAYVAGDLLPTDILVTDAVPAEVPFVAGIISTVPATPNSHVVILARSYGIPFLYVADVDAQAAIEAQVAAGGEWIFRSLRDDFGITRYTISDISGVDSGFLDELRALKGVRKLQISEVSALGAIAWPDLVTATAADINHIGGKAANFGFLRRAIPNNSPPAIAFSFDLWTGYLDQTLAGGGTLRAEIAQRLAGFSWPPDVAALDVALGGIRELVKSHADFSVGQRAEMIVALDAAGFDPDKKIRFRSSTNMEDSELFVGAGLYDSYSGCLHDDTDGDDVGPSHCDPTQAKERGVFRAMRKVYASFYNRNAFMERLRHGVDEDTVGMGLLVHHSFPDELEAANGVATGALSGSTSFAIFGTQMVTQIGAVSVTNPDGGSLPEIVDVDGFRGSFGSGGTPKLIQRSSLLPLGEDAVMTWPDDYSALTGLFVDVALEVNRPNQGYELEFEYKKLDSGELVVKQVRHVPGGGSSGVEYPALINVPTTWKLFQGERGGVFGNHRMKSQWQVEFDSRWLDADGLSHSFLSGGQLEWLPFGELVQRAGPPSAWPAASFAGSSEFGRDWVAETWTLPTAAGATDFELRLMVPSLLYNRGTAVFFPSDFSPEWLQVEFNASYATEQLEFEYDGAVGSRGGDVTWLMPGAASDLPREGSTLVHRTVTERSLVIDIEFYWPPAYLETAGGYTAPLEAWEETVITGLTTQPITLNGYYSQTYRPEHHNFSEHFLFEPKLEQGISAATLSELQGLNIRYIYVYASGGPTEKIVAVGFDGSTRELE